MRTDSADLDRRRKTRGPRTVSRERRQIKAICTGLLGLELIQLHVKVKVFMLRVSLVRLEVALLLGNNYSQKTGVQCV